MIETATATLNVEGLTIALANGEPIIEDISLTVRQGRVLGLVGESGSGKSTTALGLLGYSSPGVEITGGRVELDGTSLLNLSDKAMRKLRGRTISYVPQDPGAALNPSRRIGDAIDAMLKEHARPVNGNARAVLDRVHLPTTDEFARRFPHQLSGGQQQRVAIAIAIVCEPPIVVLDEPTTGLDVVTQAHIIQEIDRLREQHGLALVYVSHDLAVIAQVADVIAVCTPAGSSNEAQPSKSCEIRTSVHTRLDRRDPRLAPEPPSSGHSRNCSGSRRTTARLRVRTALRPAHRRMRSCIARSRHKRC